MRKVTKRPRTDVEVQDYFAKGLVVPDITYARTPFGRYASYPHIDFYPTGGLTDVPDEGCSEDVWEQDVHLKVPDESTGSNNALVVPVYCEDISLEDLNSLPRAEQLRCIWDEAHGTWVHCARRSVDGFDSAGGVVRCKYIGNMVPFAPEGTSPNCRMVLDWDWTEGKLLEERCILVSTHKMEHGFEWRLDEDFMQRQLEDGLAGDVSEPESEPEEVSALPKDGVSTRSQAQAVDVADRHAFQEAVLNALETHAISVQENNDLAREQAEHNANMSACMHRLVQMVEVFVARHCQSMENVTQLMAGAVMRGTAAAPKAPAAPAAPVPDGGETKEEC